MRVHGASGSGGGACGTVISGTYVSVGFADDALLFSAGLCVSRVERPLVYSRKSSRQGNQKQHSQKKKDAQPVERTGPRETRENSGGVAIKRAFKAVGLDSAAQPGTGRTPKV